MNGGLSHLENASWNELLRIQFFDRHVLQEILENGEVPKIMSSEKKPQDIKLVADSMLHGLGNFSRF
jgi:hypothetical protein